MRSLQRPRRRGQAESRPAFESGVSGGQPGPVRQPMRGQRQVTSPARTQEAQSWARRPCRQARSSCCSQGLWTSYQHGVPQQRTLQAGACVSSTATGEHAVKGAAHLLRRIARVTGDVRVLVAEPANGAASFTHIACKACALSASARPKRLESATHQGLLGSTTVPGADGATLSIGSCRSRPTQIGSAWRRPPAEPLSPAAPRPLDQSVLRLQSLCK